MWEEGFYVLRSDGWVVEDQEGERVFVWIAEDIEDDDEELGTSITCWFHREAELWQTYEPEL